MTDTMQTMRRTASQSMTMFRQAAGRTDSPMPANEAVASSARPAPTLNSASTEMKGSISTADGVEIQGKIEGDVRAAYITVAANARVKGDLTADTVIVHGSVEGRIQAQDVRLQSGADVTGEIAHGSLGIDTAAIFEGTIKRISTNQQ
jgi:cytoskeletal protein CcmA (bactofilin family)